MPQPQNLPRYICRRYRQMDQPVENVCSRSVLCVTTRDFFEESYLTVAFSWLLFQAMQMYSQMTYHVNHLITGKLHTDSTLCVNMDT